MKCLMGITRWWFLAILSIPFLRVLPAFAASTKLRVACVGDSITYGYGVPQRRVHAWPEVLQRLLGSRYQVVNFGHSFATMLKKGNHPYWKTSTYEAATKFDPNIVIIMLGTNDTKLKNWTPYGSRFTANTEAMIRHFARLKAHPKIYICTPPPIIHSNYGITEAVLVQGPIPDIHKAARATHSSVIRLHADLMRWFTTHWSADDYQTDGVHPNATGQKLIAQFIFRSLHVPAEAAPNAGADSGRPDQRKFFLRNGDRVLFYGDSITEQRFYTTDVELYVRTRFPHLHVRFVNSGVGGDTVGGGWAGPINVRLKRDVFAFKPNVVTIMLGMNDGGYQAFNPVLFRRYKHGYEHIVRSLRNHLPGVKIVLIAPSPFDDVTVPPHFPGGYNAVLIRYGHFVKSLAAEYHLGYVNFNKPLVQVLRKAKKINLRLAKQIIPQRVHPDANGHLVMAEALLKAWNAPATVTAVHIIAGSHLSSQSANTTVSALSDDKGTVSWIQKDKALPMPIMDLHENWPHFPPIITPVGHPFGAFVRSLWMPPAPNWHYTNPVTAMVIELCGFYRNLDSETLRVTGLPALRYSLKIDGRSIALFSRRQLAAGINLARYDTPMMTQAYRVLRRLWLEAQTRFYIWRYIQLPLEKPLPSEAWVTSAIGGPFVEFPQGKSQRVAETRREVVASLYRNLFKKVAARAYAMAKPVPCKYSLSPYRTAKSSPAIVLYYQDKFNGGRLAPLNGRQPTVDDGHHVSWAAAAGWHADGSTTSAGNAYLPFTPVSGNIYTLSACLNPERGAATGWLAIGFVRDWNAGAGHPKSGVKAFFASSAIAAGPWVAIYPNRGAGGSAAGGGGGGATVAGPGSSGITRWATLNARQNISIMLDTTTRVWSYKVTDNGVVVTPTTSLPTNPTITGVALGNALITKGAVSNFKLTIAKAAP